MLSLTLVPVLTSLLVKPRAHAETWLLRKAHALYLPLLRRSMRHRSLTVGLSVVCLALAALLFTRLGAEFVPQLDEGDLLIEARRLTGAALTESVRTDLQLERKLLKIPEIDQVVARNGAPEVATDPMSLEASDIYIELKPAQTWRRGLTKADLAREVAAVVEQSPEIRWLGVAADSNAHQRAGRGHSIRRRGAAVRV